MSTERVLLSTAYLPNLSYLAQVVNNDEVVLETYEYFVKQTYRNRCDILSSNGKLSLSIPLIKQADKEIITQKKISYAENWQQQHWRSITSAYKNSPYFEFFEDDLKPFYEEKFDFLFDYNLQLLKTILHILRVKKQFNQTIEFELKPFKVKDFRDLSNQKNNHDFEKKPYYQLFSNKYGFTPNLSCIDAVFNEGLYTLDLLK